MVERVVTTTHGSYQLVGTISEGRKWIEARDADIEIRASVQELRNMTTKVRIGPNSFMYARDGNPILYLSREAAILSRGTTDETPIG